MSSPSDKAVVDEGEWKRACALAEKLLAVSDAALGEELAVGVPPNLRTYWFDFPNSVTELVAAALCQGARAAAPRCDVTAVALCSAARAIAQAPSELFNGVPVGMDTYLRWHGSPGGRGSSREKMQLRILRALACPGGHDASGPGSGCVRAGEKAAGGAGLDWQAARVEGRMFSFSDEGLDASSCEQCGAESPWMVARPAAVTEWIWQLCRCGGAESLVLAPGTNLADLAWEHFTTRELEQAANQRGFGRLIPWNPIEGFEPHTDPAGTFEEVLPTMSRGGSPQWRGAIRAAASALARTGGDPAFPRDSDGAVGRARLLPALSLTALIAYVVADASGLGPEQLDLPQIVSAGASAVYSRLAAHLPGPEAMAALGADPNWAFRAERWPGGIETSPASRERGDPATIAWATLTGPADPRGGLGGSPGAPPALFEAAFETVRGLITA
jgi:hypothetical protein